LIAQHDARELFRRFTPIIVNVHSIVERISDPDLFLVRSQSDAMTRTTMSFGLTLRKPFHFNPMKNLACLEIANFKTKQVVYVHIAKRLISIDCEWPNNISEWTYLPQNLMRAGIHNTQQRRLQPSQVSELSIRPDDRIVRS